MATRKTQPPAEKPRIQAARSAQPPARGTGSRLAGHFAGFLVAACLVLLGWGFLAGRGIVPGPALLAEYPEILKDAARPGGGASEQARIKWQAWQKATRLGLQATLSLSEPELLALLNMDARGPELLHVEQQTLHCGGRNVLHGIPVSWSGILTVNAAGSQLELSHCYLGRVPLPAFLAGILPVHPAQELNQRLNSLFPLKSGRGLSLHPGELVITGRTRS